MELEQPPLIVRLLIKNRELCTAFHPPRASRTFAVNVRAHTSESGSGGWEQLCLLYRSGYVFEHGLGNNFFETPKLIII